MTVADGTEPLALEPETANPPPADMPEANPVQGEPVEGEEAELEVEEIDWEDGQKYAIPKALKPALMKEADYRQKTMKLADERRALETEKEAERTFIQSHARELGQLAQIEDRIAAYKNVDWATWRAQDPESARLGRDELADLRDAHQELSGKIGEAKKAETEKTQKAVAERLQATADFARTNITGWTPEMDTQMTNYVVREFDLKPDELLGIVNPKTYRMLHRLWTLDQSSRRQPPAQSRQTEAAAVPVTPVARGRAAAQPSALSDKAPTGDWIKARQAQLAKAGKR